MQDLHNQPTLFSQITLKHGPVGVLGRTILAAEQLALSKGVHLSFATGQELLAVQSAGVYWVHQDPVVKSKRVTNSAGTIVSTVELDPWGGETSRSSNDAFHSDTVAAHHDWHRFSFYCQHRRTHRL